MHVCCYCCSKFRAETDLERVQNDRKRLSSQLQQRERDLMQSQLHEKQLSRTNKMLTGKLKMEKDEVPYCSPKVVVCYFYICSKLTSHFILSPHNVHCTLMSHNFSQVLKPSHWNVPTCCHLNDSLSSELGLAGFYLSFFICFRKELLLIIYAIFVDRVSLPPIGSFKALNVNHQASIPTSGLVSSVTLLLGLTALLYSQSVCIFLWILFHPLMFLYGMLLMGCRFGGCWLSCRAEMLNISMLCVRRSRNLPG